MYLHFSQIHLSQVPRYIRLVENGEGLIIFRRKIKFSNGPPDAAAGIEKPGNSSWTKSDLLSLILILIAATVAMLPIFTAGFPKVGDAIKHYRWSSQFNAALRDGSLYPRWFPDANHGMGSPLPIYYPPVPFYVAAAFNVVTGNMLVAISLGCWLALSLSGLAMYAFSRLSLTHAASLVAALVYMFIPYHVLDLYTGAALSEFWCFVWVPLLFYYIYRVCGESGWRSAGWLAVIYALLLQTHVPSLYLTSLMLPVFAVLLTREWRKLARVAAALLFGIGLSAIFIVPVLFERKYIQIGRVLLRCDFRQYFLFEHLGEAFNTILNPSGDADYSLQTDLAATGLLLLLALVSLLYWRNGAAGMQSNDLNATSRPTLMRATFIVTTLSLFMSTRLSAPLWKVVPGLPFLLFPFRWLVITSAGAAMLTAAALHLLTRNVKRRAFYSVALALVILFNLTVSALAIMRAPRKPETLERRLSRREAPEYHPVWWDSESDSDFDQTPVIILSGNADVQAIKGEGIKQSYSVTAGTEATLKLRPLYFPGWVARVDGHPVQVRPSSEGNIQLSIEPGEHLLELSFEDTWPRRAGKTISIVCFLALLLLLYLTHHETPQRGKQAGA
jgi:hypothetical protein